MEKEIWKDIIGFEGYYQVSSFGNIRSVDRYIQNNPNASRKLKGKNLKQKIGIKGYHLICLHKNGSNKFVRVPRIVGEMFVENPLNKPQINHKDGDKSNNNASNLEWATCLENITHSVKNGFHKSGSNHVQSKPVIQMTLDKKFIKRHGSMMCAFRDTGVADTGISLCCANKRKHAGGFLWKLAI